MWVVFVRARAPLPALDAPRADEAKVDDGLAARIMCAANAGLEVGTPPPRPALPPANGAAAKRPVHPKAARFVSKIT